MKRFADLVCRSRRGTFLTARFVLVLVTFWFVREGCAAAQAAPAASALWDSVQQLAPQTHLKIAADQHGGACVLQTVSPDGLVCLHGKGTRSVARAEIRSIKLARKGRSAGLGLAVGAGVGLAVGVGIGEAINGSDKGSFVHVSAGKSAAVGAGIGVIVGAGVGTLVGYGTDLFAGPVIYRR